MKINNDKNYRITCEESAPKVRRNFKSGLTKSQRLNQFRLKIPEKARHPSDDI